MPETLRVDAENHKMMTGQICNDKKAGISKDKRTCWEVMRDGWILNKYFNSEPTWETDNHVNPKDKKKQKESVKGMKG